LCGSFGIQRDFRVIAGKGMAYRKDVGKKILQKLDTRSSEPASSQAKE
jgi:hypothetical protein